MNTVRKCMTITKENVNYVNKLVKQRKARSFSGAVNEAIEQRRTNEQKNINNN